MKINFHPRNDWCLLRIVEVGETDSGIAVPQIAVEGKEFVIVAVGDKVEGLRAGRMSCLRSKLGVGRPARLVRW